METSTPIVRCLAAILLLCNLAAAEVCPTEYVSLSGGCFKFVRDAKSFAAAESICENEGSTLADVEDNSQMAALLDYINANFPGTFWTSGQFKNGRYEWANTEQQVPQGWRGRKFRNENNMCTYVCSRTHKIWDSRCSTPMRFICKRNNLDLDLDSIEAF